MHLEAWCIWVYLKFTQTDFSEQLKWVTEMMTTLSGPLWVRALRLFSSSLFRHPISFLDFEPLNFFSTICSMTDSSVMFFFVSERGPVSMEHLASAFCLNLERGRGFGGVGQLLSSGTRTENCLREAGQTHQWNQLQQWLVGQIRRLPVLWART